MSSEVKVFVKHMDEKPFSLPILLLLIHPLSFSENTHRRHGKGGTTDPKGQNHLVFLIIPRISFMEKDEMLEVMD